LWDGVFCSVGVGVGVCVCVLWCVCVFCGVCVWCVYAVWCVVVIVVDVLCVSVYLHVVSSRSFHFNFGVYFYQYMVPMGRCCLIFRQHFPGSPSPFLVPSFPRSLIPPIPPSPNCSLLSLRQFRRLGLLTENMVPSLIQGYSFPHLMLPKKTTLFCLSFAML